MHMRTHKHAHTHTHLFIHMYIYIYVYIHVYVPIDRHIPICICTHTHTYMCICISTSICIYTENVPTEHMRQWVLHLRGPLARLWITKTTQGEGFWYTLLSKASDKSRFHGRGDLNILPKAIPHGLPLSPRVQILSRQSTHLTHDYDS